MDITRIPVYVLNNRDVITDNVLLLLIVTISAFGGTFAGKGLLKKLPLKAFRIYVASAVIVIGILLKFRVI